MSRLVALVFLLCGVACEEREVDIHGYPIAKDVKIIYCKEFDPTSSRGWRVVKYETIKKYPLYRGGWDFTTVKGVDILNTNCSYNSTNK